MAANVFQERGWKVLCEARLTQYQC